MQEKKFPIPRVSERVQLLCRTWVVIASCTAGAPPRGSAMLPMVVSVRMFAVAECLHPTKSHSS
jgi:hypothetical protein